MSRMHKVKWCEPSTFAKRLPKLLFDFVYGLESEIPFCCAVEFTIRSNIFGQLVDLAMRRPGHVYDSQFVPCVWHRFRWSRRVYEPGEVRPTNTP